jgi:uncharacterized membrane protein YkoI
MKNIRSFRRFAIPFSLAMALLAASAVAVSPRAMADHHDDHHGHDDHVEARTLLQRGEILPLSRILTIVRQQVPGDVIEVELDHGKHGWEYEVKVLTASGLVREVKLNAGNGAIRKVKDD